MASQTRLSSFAPQCCCWATACPPVYLFDRTVVFGTALRAESRLHIVGCADCGTAALLTQSSVTFRVMAKCAKSPRPSLPSEWQYKAPILSCNERFVSRATQVESEACVVASGLFLQSSAQWVMYCLSNESKLLNPVCVFPIVRGRGVMGNNICICIYF